MPEVSSPRLLPRTPPLLAPSPFQLLGGEDATAEQRSEALLAVTTRTVHTTTTTTTSTRLLSTLHTVATTLAPSAGPSPVLFPRRLRLGQTTTAEEEELPTALQLPCCVSSLAAPADASTLSVSVHVEATIGESEEGALSMVGCPRTRTASPPPSRLRLPEDGAPPRRAESAPPSTSLLTTLAQLLAAAADPPHSRPLSQLGSPSSTHPNAFLHSTPCTPRTVSRPTRSQLKVGQQPVAELRGHERESSSPPSSPPRATRPPSVSQCGLDDSSSGATAAASAPPTCPPSAAALDTQPDGQCSGEATAFPVSCESIAAFAAAMGLHPLAPAQWLQPSWTSPPATWSPVDRSAHPQLWAAMGFARGRPTFPCTQRRGRRGRGRGGAGGGEPALVHLPLLHFAPPCMRASFTFSRREEEQTTALPAFHALSAQLAARMEATAPTSASRAEWKKQRKGLWVD